MSDKLRELVAKVRGHIGARRQISALSALDELEAALAEKPAERPREPNLELVDWGLTVADKYLQEISVSSQEDELRQCLQIIMTNAGNIKDDRDGPILEQCDAIEAAVQRASNIKWQNRAERPQLSAEQRASDWLTPEWLLDVLREYAPNAAKAMGWQTLKQVADALAMPGNTKPAPAAPPVLQAADPEKWPEMQCITFASIEDRKQCQQLINEMCREAEQSAFEKAAQHVPIACEAMKRGATVPEYFIECTCGWNHNGKFCRGVGDHGLWAAHIRALGGGKDEKERE
jgi:hypothetical protein